MAVRTINCVWKCSNRLFDNGCRRQSGFCSDVCGTTLCAWAQDASDVEKSLEKARSNFKKRYGFDGYDKLVYTPRGMTDKEMLESFLCDRRTNEKKKG